MNLAYAVAVDLLQFAYMALFGRLETHPHSADNAVVWHVEENEQQRMRVAPHSSAVLETLHQNALDKALEIPPITPQRNTIIYVATVGAPLRTNPHTGIDNVIRHIPYGSMLVALETLNGWVRVFHKGTEGYVSLDDVVDRSAYVYPKFIIGEVNLSSDPNTERVRAMIEDAFSCGESDLPLQAEEYALYKIIRTGAKVVWGDVRPRVPGTWNDIFSKSDTVKVSAEPKSRTVMEYRFENGQGHLSFVESAFDDGTLKVSEANWPSDGIYNERMIVREEWEKLAPKFILFG